MPKNNLSLKLTSLQWKLWLQWIVVSTLGWVISWILATSIFDMILAPSRQYVEYSSNPEAGWTVGYMTVCYGLPVCLLVFGFGGGIMTGALQWLILKRYIPLSRQWILCCGKSWIVGLIITLITGAFIFCSLGTFYGLTHSESETSTNGLFLAIMIVLASVGGIIGGAIVGNMQFSILQPHTESQGKKHWEYSNSIAIAIAVIFTLAGGYNIEENNPGTWAILQTLIGIIMTTITGFTLVQLLKYPE